MPTRQFSSDVTVVTGATGSSSVYGNDLAAKRHKRDTSSISSAFLTGGFPAAAEGDRRCEGRNRRGLAEVRHPYEQQQRVGRGADCVCDTSSVSAAARDAYIMVEGVVDGGTTNRHSNSNWTTSTSALTERGSGGSFFAPVRRSLSGKSPSAVDTSSSRVVHLVK